MLFFLPVASAAQSGSIRLWSPAHTIGVQVSVADGQLTYSVAAQKKTIIQPSALGIIINQQAYGTGVKSIRSTDSVLVHNINAGPGNTIGTSNPYRSYTIAITDERGEWKMEFRLFDNGCAFRYLLEGTQAAIINGERSAFTLPEGSRVWFFERDSDWKLKSYAGWWKQTAVDSLPLISKMGPIQGKPLVVQQVSGTYIVLTEAALYNYSGLRYRATGHRTVQADFTEGEKGFATNAAETPWRVVLYARDLNALVNNQVINHLNPQPDEKLFAKADYVRPGRSVWSWISRKENYMQPSEEMRFVDAAAKLRFEYTMVDDGWETAWPNKWTQLTALCQYAAAKKVGVWIWKDSKGLRNIKVRDAFLDSIKMAGAVGIKTDFMNSEAKELIDFETGLLEAAAQRRLMVNFHGCQAPTGESIRYPNEMTREGIRGMELNIMKEPIPAWHNAALPFTRFLCGAGDYTPGFFFNRGNTTYTHQLALLYLFHSPLQTVSEDPGHLLQDSVYRPIVPLLQSLPVTWDETVVIPGSAIGKIAALAKRKGADWYLAVINGMEEPQQLPVSFSFLQQNTRYRATVVADNTAQTGFTVTQQLLLKNSKTVLVIPATGGVVIQLKKA